MRADADLVEPRQQAELGQLLDRVRQRIDADAELADGVGLLENLAVEPAACSIKAVVSPPIPPPMMMAFIAHAYAYATEQSARL